MKRKGTRRAGDNLTNDKPVADRLDRSYFGFDQDYYERMPLLVNAMQENSYIDPTGDAIFDTKEPPKKIKKPKAISISNKTNNINFKPSQYRRTSPRPFIFEYKSPTPIPFSKTYGSKSWIESYRNAQRLQNIQQVIKYLEKTINAKIGDMYAEPTSKHIAFTGVYVEPSMNDKVSVSDTSQVNLEILNNNSERMDTFSNHKSDPLFKYKPGSPGEVNLLADSFLRFSPTLFEKYDSNIPMFKPIPDRKKHCIGHSCENIEYNLSSTHSNVRETRVPEPSSFSKAKSFSVMLNLFPLKTSTEKITKSHDKIRPSPTDKIYITTSKPLIFFKTKSRSSNKRRTIPVKRPRVINEDKLLLHKSDYESDDISKKNHSLPSASSMIVQINLYTPEKSNEITTKSAIIVDSIKSSPSNSETNKFVPISPYTTDVPINLSTTQVEDFHVGSSGIIPIEERFTPSPPTMTTLTTLSPPFDITVSSTEGTWYTKPPDILKFSHEDARITDDFGKYPVFDYPERLNTNRRTFRDHFYDGDIESQTILTKTNNSNVSSKYKSDTEDIFRPEETTTVTTTTQINGHYRNMNRNSKILSTLLDPNSEINKKRRLSLLAKGFRRPDFSLSYTEIKRNRTELANDQ